MEQNNQNQNPFEWGWRGMSGDEMVVTTIRAFEPTRVLGKDLLFRYEIALRQSLKDGKPIDLALTKEMNQVYDACKTNFGLALSLYAKYTCPVSDDKSENQTQTADDKICLAARNQISGNIQQFVNRYYEQTNNMEEFKWLSSATDEMEKYYRDDAIDDANYFGKDSEQYKESISRYRKMEDLNKQFQQKYERMQSKQTETGLER